MKKNQIKIILYFLKCQIWGSFTLQKQKSKPIQAYQKFPTRQCSMPRAGGYPTGDRGVATSSFHKSQ